MVTKQNTKANTYRPGRISRRVFLQTSAQIAVGSMIPSALFANDYPPRHLSFYHIHTREKISIDYSHKTYGGSVRRAIEYFLRDFRTGEIHIIDPRLLDVLAAILHYGKIRSGYEVISGYRSAKTNEFLRKVSSGVDPNSYHMEGRAIDVRLPGVPTHILRDLALKFNDGGVGFYPKSKFVHIDTGKRRRWSHGLEPESMT